MNPKPKIDPELVRQLEHVESTRAIASESTEEASEPVQAVIYLHPDAPNQLTVSPERIGPVVDSLLSRVGNRVGVMAHKHNTFRNLGSFALSATPSFIRELLKQPEVASAVANRKAT